MTKPVEKTIEMTKRQFNAWYNGLRSGKYKQANGEYCETYDGRIVAHCCLAVLEDVLTGGIENINVTTPSDSFMTKYNITFRGPDGNPTTEALNRHGNNPFLGNFTAIELNDDQQLSFKQIAQRLKNRVKFIPEKKSVKKAIKKNRNYL